MKSKVKAVGANANYSTMLSPSGGPVVTLTTNASNTHLNSMPEFAKELMIVENGPHMSSSFGKNNNVPLGVD